MSDLETRVRHLERMNRAMALAITAILGVGIFCGAVPKMFTAETLQSKMLLTHEILLLDDDGNVCAMMNTDKTRGTYLDIWSGKPRSHVSVECSSDGESRLSLGTAPVAEKRPEIELVSIPDMTYIAMNDHDGHTRTLLRRKDSPDSMDIMILSSDKKVLWVAPPND